MTTPATADTSAAQPPSNLAALRAFIDVAPDCRSRDRREWSSAICGVGRWLGKPLDRIPTDPASLRRHFATLNPAAIGVTPQYLANVKSHVRQALKFAGVTPTNRPLAESLSPRWMRLFDRLGHDNRYLRTSLGPFGRFCTACGLPPEAVTDAVANDYLTHLEMTALSKQPRTTHQTVCRTWNKAKERVPGWPDVCLSVPSYADFYSYDLDCFPVSFREELESYLTRLACDNPVDLLDENLPARPLRPSSIKTKRYQIRAFASALVRTGVPINSITSLATLTTIEHFKLGLTYILDRPRGDKGNTLNAGLIAHTIRSIAKHHVQVPESALKALNAITAKLNRREPGMIDKNRARLSQFDDPVVLMRFLDMPPKETDRLRRKGVATRHDAVEFSNLVALEILVHVPLRVANLAALEVGHSILLPAGGRRGETTISIGGRDVKNRQLLQYTLPEHVTDLIIFHLERVKPLLELHDSDFLFPNGRGRSKRADTLSKQLSSLVWTKLGIDFNPHLMRHLAAKIYIDERPGDYEGPRRLLGHASSQTTYATYEGLEKKSATLLHAELIRQKRRYVPMSERPRSARRLRSKEPVQLSKRKK